MKSVKILFVSFLLVLYSASLFAQSSMLDQNVTLKANNESIHSLIKTIENTYNIQFAYTNFKALEQKVSIEVSEQKLGDVLELLFKNTNLKFKEIDGQIVIYEQAPKPAKPAAKQNFTIHGYISDSQSSERLINAAVYQPGDFKGTTSNNFGFYSITLPGGHVELAASYMGYEPQLFTFNLKADTSINIEMLPTSDQLDEITVYGNHVNKVDDTQMSMVEIPLQKINRIPVFFGEPDILKIIQLYPGIQSGMEGTSGIQVRGGSSDQNLYIIDGVPIYNVNHLAGFFSTFNPSAIKSVNVFKGGFPAHYGGRLSSVVDVRMKDGNLKEIKGDFTIGLLSSKFMLEGPLQKNKTSFMVSARRTYADLFIKPILAISNSNSDVKKNIDVYFYDLNTKLSHKFSNKSKLYWSLYHGKDLLQTVETTEDAKDSITSKDKMQMGWSNTISSVRWNYLFSNKLFCNTALSFSNFYFKTIYSYTDTFLKNDYSATEYYRYYSGIRDLSANIDFDYFPNTKHTVMFGSGATHHIFRPGVSVSEEDAKNNLKETYTDEFFIYIEDEIALTNTLSINAGVRLTLLSAEVKNYFTPQPRLSVRYKPLEKIAVKTSYSRMVQHVHLLTSTGLELPTDLWVPVTSKFDPPLSDQMALGVATNLKKGYNLTIEGFYKYMQNLIAYKEGASYTGGNVNWETLVEQGIGWSYGAEFLLEKTIGNTTGWLGYTWSKTERQFENINFGKAFPYKYDRRHNVSLVVNHNLNDHINISGTWVFKTGSATTVALAKYPLTGIPTYDNDMSTYYVYNYNNRNGYRLPNYHRLDLGISFIKEKMNGVRTWNISVFNAYNRLNTFMLTQKFDYSDEDILDENGVSLHPKKIYSLSIFPIIPSVSYSFKF